MCNWIISLCTWNQQKTVNQQSPILFFWKDYTSVTIPLGNHLRQWVKNCHLHKARFPVQEQGVYLPIQRTLINIRFNKILSQSSNSQLPISQFQHKEQSDIVKHRQINPKTCNLNVAIWASNPIVEYLSSSNLLHCPLRRVPNQPLILAFGFYPDGRNSPRRDPNPQCCCHCSVAQVCLTLGHPIAYNMPGFPVLHYLLGFAQTCFCWVGDAIQQSNPL